MAADARTGPESAGGDRVIAIVPARGGSKGIPNKNLASLAGKPLVAWTLDAANRAASVSRVVVSSDSEQILEVCAALGAETLARPAELATDTASSESVLRHVLETLAGRGESPPELTLLLQPTSPLRTAAHIDAAIAMLDDADADAVISVFSPRHSLYKAFRLDERGFLRGAFGDDAPFLPRQSVPTLYLPNGAIYLVRTALFLESGSLLPARTVAYEMSEAESIDIDVAADLTRAETSLLARRDPNRPWPK